MLDLITTLLGGVLSGGATGLLGVLLQRFFDLKHKQQEVEVVKLNLANSIELSKMENERAQIRANADTAAAQIQADGAYAVAEQETQAREAEAESRNLQAAFDADKSTYLLPAAQLQKGFWGTVITMLMALVDFMRGALRPLLTAYFVVLTTYIFVWTADLTKASGALSQEQVNHIVVMIITNVLYLSTVSALFWFGTRPPNKQQ